MLSYDAYETFKRLSMHSRCFLVWMIVDAFFYVRFSKHRCFLLWTIFDSFSLVHSLNRLNYGDKLRDENNWKVAKILQKKKKLFNQYCNLENIFERKCWYYSASTNKQKIQKEIQKRKGKKRKTVIRYLAQTRINSHLYSLSLSLFLLLHTQKGFLILSSFQYTVTQCTHHCCHDK